LVNSESWSGLGGGAGGVNRMMNRKADGYTVTSHVVKRSHQIVFSSSVLEPRIYSILSYDIIHVALMPDPS
jgi:hypothetical protein